MKGQSEYTTTSTTCMSLLHNQVCKPSVQLLPSSTSKQQYVAPTMLCCIRFPVNPNDQDLFLTRVCLSMTTFLIHNNPPLPVSPLKVKENRSEPPGVKEMVRAVWCSSNAVLVGSTNPPGPLLLTSFSLWPAQSNCFSLSVLSCSIPLLPSSCGLPGTASQLSSHWAFLILLFSPYLVYTG